MNLQQILKYKKEILDIAKRFGFSDIRIHNVVAAWMETDEEGALPLTMVAYGGNPNDSAICLAFLENILGCKVDLIIVENNPVGALYNETNSVSLKKEYTSIITALEKIFQSSLNEIDVSRLTQDQKEECEDIVTMYSSSSSQQEMLSFFYKKTDSRDQQNLTQDAEVALGFFIEDVEAALKKEEQIYLTLNDK